MILAAVPNLVETFPTEKKKHDPTVWFKILFLCSLCLFFISCAHSPEKKFAYNPTANATDEIRNLQTEMSRAESEQIAVFAPTSYKDANRSLEKAKSLQEKGASNEKVLDELGDARGFFEQAKAVAAHSQRELTGVVDARENALVAGAALHRRKDLREADEKLKDVTEEFEKKSPSISLEKKTDLQNRYLGLELNSIKATRLGDAQSAIEGAKKMGAEKYAPRTLASAEAKLKAAEININTDRHNDALITASSGEALHEAQKLVKVTDLSRKTGKTGNESLALGIVERDEQINALNEQRAQEQLKLQQQQALMQQQEAQSKEEQQRLQQQRSLAEAQAQSQLTEAQKKEQAAQQALEARRRLDEAYQQAQNRFTKQEAEVFRQGDNLILRMRSVRFPSGGADIPRTSFASLNKVRDVIQTMKANRVVVEGHTDSTGKPETNQRLSEERAQAVADYLRSDVDKRSGGGSAVEIESQGYGWEHPLSSNKTKQGRALNRRVDIIISPNLMNQDQTQNQNQNPNSTQTPSQNQ